MTTDLRESPAGHLREACAAASVPGVVTLREIPFLPQTEVRARDEAAAARLLGGLPGPGRADRHGERTVLWCGPGWYLVVGPPPGTAAGDGVAVVDTSAARTTLELRGPCARDVLGHGCRLDLHPRVFGPGSAARTNLARATVVLHQVDAEPGYLLYVGGSYADYLVTWLLDAMTPYVRG
ncbi:MAG TPA: sarcosine oxidase subunit gamma family protein [Streptosporangiaceae bacterium]